MYSRIAGTGRYLPERVMTNFDLEKLVETSDEWIRTRTGIERRHIAADDETTSTLATHAARNAMEAAGVTAADIDFIAVGTTTPDVVFPNVATIVQSELGIRGCPAIGMEAACSGFIYALSTADAFVRTGQAGCALVIGVETLTRMLDWSDRSTCVIFGDGAGAVVIKTAEEPGIVSCHLGADGAYRDLLYFPYGASKKPQQGEPSEGFITMRGNEVFKVAVKTLESTAREALEANNLEPADVDWWVPHQANTRIIQATAKRLGVSMDKVILTVQDHGNTSAASVPMALDVAVRDGRIQPGQLVLMEAFGGGFTWGSVLLRF